MKDRTKEMKSCGLFESPDRLSSGRAVWFRGSYRRCHRRYNTLLHEDQTVIAATSVAVGSDADRMMTTSVSHALFEIGMCFL